MTQAKLLVIVTNDALRRMLVHTWSETTIGGMGGPGDEPTSIGAGQEPVAFSRVEVKEDLSLYLFIVDGGWQREYVCQALARRAAGYCLIVGPEDEEALLAADLMMLLHASGAPKGLMAAADAAAARRLRETLQLPDDTSIPTVDCESAESFKELLTTLLERLAAAAAA